MDDAQTKALVDGAKAALLTLGFVALGVSSQGEHDFTEMLTILTLVCVVVVGLQMPNV